MMNAPENRYLSVLQKDSMKGDLILGFPWGEKGAQGIIQIFLYQQFCLNQGKAISLVLSATSRAKNEKRKEDNSRRGVKERRTHVVYMGVRQRTWGSLLRSPGGSRTWLLPVPRLKFG